MGLQVYREYGHASADLQVNRQRHTGPARRPRARAPATAGAVEPGSVPLAQRAHQPSSRIHRRLHRGGAQANGRTPDDPRLSLST